MQLIVTPISSRQRFFAHNSHVIITVTNIVLTDLKHSKLEISVSLSTQPTVHLKIAVYAQSNCLDVFS